jgi:glycolate oxidase
VEYTNLNSEILDGLAAIVGPGNVMTEAELIEPYSHDEFAEKDIRRLPACVVRPGSTGEVSKILNLADIHRIPVTPRGGGTGLCGGCVPVSGGIVLSLERMKRIIDIDKTNLMAVVEAGVTLREFYEAIENSGLLFPPHPGDEGAQIGGLIATNAGGARAVKYGVIRNYVRGMEVVLAGGKVIELGGKLMKSSTGYSLLNLMTGSEGTLGIVTKATLNLTPPPGAMFTLVVPFKTIADAIRTVPLILINRIIPMAVEFIDMKAITVTERHLNRKWPCEEGEAHLMFIVDAPDRDDLLELSGRISEICLSEGAIDVYVADDSEKQKNVLTIRSLMYEALHDHMIDLLDVCVPRASIDRFVNEVREAEKAFGVWLPVYGHAADGNVHVHLMKDAWDDGVWKAIPDSRNKAHAIRDRLHEAGRRLDGVVSGEHGIGIVKKQYMPLFLDAAQLELMKGIKKVFDPNGIMNPGKVIP